MNFKFFKFYPHKENNWHLTAPFIYVIELSVKKIGDHMLYPIINIRWPNILEKILPYADKIIFEGEEPLLHPDINGIIETLEENNCRYDFLTRMKWENPRSKIRQLKNLKGLDRLRISNSSIINGPFSEYKKNVKFAVASGIQAWPVINLLEKNLDTIKNFIRWASDLQIPGISFNISNTYTRLDDDFMSTLLDFKNSGFSIYIEQCLPIELSPLQTRRCSWHEGICLIDAYGCIKKCRHSEKPMGNITSSSIEDIWKKTDFDLDEKDCSKQSYIEFNVPHEKSPVELDQGLLPIPLYRLRRESFGAILFKGYDFIKISKRAIKIIEILDGQHSLKDLNKKFGRESLSFVYGLFERNMIRFSRKD